MKSSSSHSHSSGDSIADVAGERAKQYIDSGVEAYHAVSDKTGEISRQVDSYIRTNPWPMVGAAAGVGFLLGLMIRRR